MNNAERRRELEYLAEIYCPGDEDLIVSRMPLQHEDEDDALYAEYFNFLQTIYGLRGKTTESASDMMKLKQHLLDVAQKFRYPTNQIAVVGDYK